MSLPLFNPFVRYVVIRTDVVHYPGEYGYSDYEEVSCPVHYTDDLKNAENVCYALGKVKEGRYQVHENAAWKALDKRRTTLKATGYGDGGELPGIATQLGIAAEVLHDMLEPPSCPEETYCEKCEQKTGSFTKTLCPDCERYAASLGQKKERFTQKSRDLSLGSVRPHRQINGASLERTDEPDTPTAKPEGSAVWAKTEK